MVSHYNLTRVRLELKAHKENTQDKQQGTILLANIMSSNLDRLYSYSTSDTNWCIDESVAIQIVRFQIGTSIRTRQYIIFLIIYYQEL